MIKKLNLEEVDNPGEATLKAFSILNQLVDAVNELQHDNSEKANCQGSVLTMVDNQVTANLPNIDLGELAFLSKENSDLKDELERIRKVLDRAKWWLNEIVENHRCTPISTAEMALKDITTLEQKD